MPNFCTPSTLCMQHKQSKSIGTKTEKIEHKMLVKLTKERKYERGCSVLSYRTMHRSVWLLCRLNAELIANA